MISSFVPSKTFVSFDNIDISSIKLTLENYGLSFSPCFKNESLSEEYSKLRTKIITDSSFNNEYVSAVILPNLAIRETINSDHIVDYLLNKKIVSFYSLDNKLAKLEYNSQLYSSFDKILNIHLTIAKNRHCIGIKTRCLIYSSDQSGIKLAINEQFKIAKKTIAFGLIPIIQIEVDSRAADKAKAEQTILNEISKRATLFEENKIIYLLTFPEKDNFYLPLLNMKSSLGILVSTDDYSILETKNKLNVNERLVPMISKKLISNLSVTMCKKEFSESLENTIKLFI